MPNKKDISVFGTSGSGDDLRLENQPFRDVTIAKRKKVPSKNAGNSVDDIYSNSFVLENGERLSTVVPDFSIKENECGKFGGTSKTEYKKTLSHCHNIPNNRQSNQPSSSSRRVEDSDDERAEQNEGYRLRSRKAIKEDVLYSDDENDEIQKEVPKPTLGRSNQFAKNASNSQNQYSNKSTHISSQNTSHCYNTRRTSDDNHTRKSPQYYPPERQDSNSQHVPSTTNPNFGGGFKPPYNAPLLVEKSLPSAPTNISPIPLRLIQTSPPNFVPASNQAYQNSSPENCDTQKRVTAKPVYGGFKPPYNAPIAPEKTLPPVHSNNLPIPLPSIHTSPLNCPPNSNQGYQNSSSKVYPGDSNTTTKSVARGFKPPYNAPIAPSPVQAASSNRANVSPHIYDIPYDNQQQTLSRQSSQSSHNRDGSYNSQQESLLRHSHIEQPRCHDYIASSPKVYDIPRHSSLNQHQIVSRESFNNIDNRIPAHQNVSYYSNSRQESESHADEPLRHDYRAKSQQRPHPFQDDHFYPQVEHPHRNNRSAHSSNTYQHRRSDSDYSEHYATPNQHSHLVEPLRHDYGSGSSSRAASNNNYYFEESDHSDDLVDDRHSNRRQHQQYARNEKHYHVHDRDFKNVEKFGYANEYEYAQTRQNIDRRLPQARHNLPQRSLNNNDIDDEYGREYAQPRQNNNYCSMDRPLPPAQHYLSQRSLNAPGGSAFSRPVSTVPRNQQQRSMTAIPPGLRAIEPPRDQNQQINSMIRGIRMMINTADGDLDLRRVGRILGIENLCSHPSYLDGFDSNYSWEHFISDYMPEIGYDRDLDGEFIFHKHSV